MQNLNLILTKILLLFFGTSLIIFGGFSFVIIGAFTFVNSNTSLFLFLNLVCGIIPLFLGVRLVNQFGKMTKLDYQEKHKLAHNSSYNLVENSVANKYQVFQSQKLIQKQNNFSKSFFNKKEDLQIHLHSVFYHLLETKNGYLTTLNFAMEAKVSGKIAGEFLTQKTKEFNHQIIVDNDGGLAWKFEYLTQNEIENLKKD